MTVSYTADVANASSFGCFTTILLRWKGSVYKLIFKELFIYIIVYFALNIFYRVVLVREGLEEYRQMFEATKAYCSIQISSIPMTFGLGFYVSLIVKRWWDQYQLLPWPDSLAIFIVGLLQGLDDRSRIMRRNIMRYTLLAYVITLRRISFRVRKRFPTMQHVVDAGLMRSDELKCIEILDEKCSVSKWWMPLVWATNIVDRARQENRVKSDPGMQTILKEISAIRAGLTGVQHYDTISVPLVYTQVVTLAVYSYFGAALMGAQWVEPSKSQDYQITYRLPPFSKPSNGTFNNHSDAYNPLDLYYPFFLTLQFVFYVGWLKVAEILINPFGEDDDDFELNYIIDRHVQVSYMIVDEMHHDHPELLKDMYWNETVPAELPYTVDTEHYRKLEPKGGAEKVFDEETNYAQSQYRYGLFKQNNASEPKSFSIIKDKNVVLRNYDVPQRRGDGEPSSDYESVDTSIFGWWKARLRKSQMRRSGRSLSSNSTVFQKQHRKSNKSLRSQKSIYARILNNSKVPVTSPVLSGAKTTDEEHRPPKIKVQDEEDGFDDEADFDRFRQASCLTTITENQNSPYSTHTGSRRNSRPYPTAEGVFEGNPSPLLKDATATANISRNGSSESVAYYPIAGGISNEDLRRPDSSNSARYPDDVANYEEVSVETKDEGIVMKQDNLTPPVMVPRNVPVNPPAYGINQFLVKQPIDSPALPKRQARLAFDAIGQRNQDDNPINIIYDETIQNDTSDTKELIPPPKSNSISSAFENDAFYV